MAGGDVEEFHRSKASGATLLHSGTCHFKSPIELHVLNHGANDSRFDDIATSNL